VYEIFKDRATLTWKVPEEDGGTPVTGYNVERAAAGSVQWVKINKKLIVETKLNDQVIKPLNTREILDTTCISFINFFFRIWLRSPSIITASQR
jgi:hypothetical protein